MKAISCIAICCVLFVSGCGTSETKCQSPKEDPSPQGDELESKAPDDPKRAALMQLEELERQLTHYRFDNGEFPGTNQGLSALSDEVAADPWGNPYQYEFDSQTKKVRLWSSGPDGRSGTDDDISTQP